MKHYIEAKDKLAFLSMSREIRDTITDTLESSCSNGLSNEYAKSMAPFRVLINQKLNGISITASEFATIQSFLMSKGRRFKNSHYKDNYNLSVSMSTLPAFLGLPELESTPKQSITYQSSSAFTTKCYRTWLDKQIEHSGKGLSSRVDGEKITDMFIKSFRRDIYHYNQCGIHSTEPICMDLYGTATTREN